MLKPVPILVALLLAAGCDASPSSPVAADHAVVTLPAVPGRPGAAYFTLRSRREPVRLVGISSPRVGRIELHRTSAAGGVSRMTPLREVVVSPDAPLQFSPGGAHAMLFDVDPSLHVGDHVPLTFRFDAVAPLTVEAEVRAPGDAGNAAH